MGSVFTTVMGASFWVASGILFAILWNAPPSKQTQFTIPPGHRLQCDVVPK